MRPLVYFGDGPDERTAEQARVCQESGPVHGMALMADNHLGYAVPIGGVIAYHDAISPSGVGFDIGCGVKAVKTNLAAGAIADPVTLNDALDEIQSSIEFGVGRSNEVIIDHPVMDSALWDEVPRGIRELKQQASRQLGTVGAGNHYVDILIEEDDDGIGLESPVWVACHFGSRGLGHKTATYFLKQLGARDEIMAPPAVIDSTHVEYAQYLTAMQLAGDYAYAGRDIVIGQVLEILGAESFDEIHNHHNFAWSEVHDGESLMVVRKGATPAWPEQRGFVGGSMGDIAAVVEGTNAPATIPAYHSTVHGAGRLHSRTWAKGKRDRKTGEVTTPGNVSSGQMHEALREFGGVQLRGGDVDESPFVYRKLDGVLAAQGDTIIVRHRLRPVGVVMAGPNTFDPFKD
jgi:tRNA-splicing ligase RtcB (3'-phosphate/5'-hydroxy nucleic acid ligase)